MHILFCLLLMRGGLFLLPAQEARDAKTLLSELARASEKDKPRILNQLADSLVNQNQSGEVYAYYAKMALIAARKNGDEAQEALALKNMAYGSFRLEKFQDALEYYYQSRALYQRLGDWNGVGVNNLEIGNLCQYCFNDFNTARKYYEKSLENYRHSGDRYSQARNLNNIGEIYRKLGQYETAVGFYVEGLKTSEPQTTTLLRNAQATILLNLCDMYMLLEKYDLSLQHLNQAKAIIAADKHRYKLAAIYSRLGDLAKIQLHYQQAFQYYSQALKIREEVGYQRDVAAELYKLGDAYAQANMIPQALASFARALNIRRQADDKLGLAQSLLGLGRICRRQGQSKQALSALQEGLQLCLKNEFDYERKDFYLELSEVYAMMHQAAEGLRYRKLYEETKEKVQGVRVAAGILEVMNRYEQEKMSERISLLRKAKVHITLLIVIIVPCLLATLGFLFLHSRRIRSRTGNLVSFRERQLVEKQSELEALKAKLIELQDEQSEKKYQKSSLSIAQARACLEKVNEVMEKERAFLDSELTLGSLADKLGVNTRYLSQVINEYMGKSFTDFLSRLRVEEAKKLLRQNHQEKQSILAVGFAVGFNSKSHFYSAFKKNTGLTPKQFQKRSSPTAH